MNNLTLVFFREKLLTIGIFIVPIFFILFCLGTTPYLEPVPTLEEIASTNLLCDVPYNLDSVYPDSIDKVHFTWKDIPDAQVYQVEWYTDENSTPVLVTVFTNKISFSLGLTRGNIYCKVRSVCGSAFSIWSYTYHVKIS